MSQWNWFDPQSHSYLAKTPQENTTLQSAMSQERIFFADIVIDDCCTLSISLHGLLGVASAVQSSIGDTSNYAMVQNFSQVADWNDCSIGSPNFWGRFSIQAGPLDWRRAPVLPVLLPFICQCVWALPEGKKQVWFNHSRHVWLSLCGVRVSAFSVAQHLRLHHVLYGNHLQVTVRLWRLRSRP